MSEPYASWVYAVVPATAAALAGLPAGIGGRPVRRVAAGGIAAAVSSVSRAEVGEEALRRHRGDPAWLERHARAHHAVVTACFQAGPTVPFRLATLYHDDTGVRGLLEHRREQLVTALAAVTRRAEWGVQAYAVTPRSDPAEPTEAASGTEYLLRRRAARAARERERSEAYQAAHRIELALAGSAVAAREQPLSGSGGMVLNRSYLVDEADRERFLAAIDRLAAQHATVCLRMTGPWPAYSFVEIGGGTR